MAVYTEDLYYLRGRVKSQKPNAPTEEIDSAVNDRIRQIWDRHPWSDSLRIGVININNAYNTGTVTFTPGSNIVAGNGTAWPVNDAVNTALTNAVTDPSVQKATPNSMAGISAGMFLLIDYGTAFQEVVQVIDTSVTTFTASFSKPHAAAATIWASSQANRQIKAPFPVFTVMAVLTATSLQIDQIWQGQAGTSANQPYNIYDGYLSVTPNTRRIEMCWDPIAGNPLETNHTYQELEWQDPQRTDTNNPLWLVLMPSSPVGIARFELYPAQMVSYQLSVVTVEQWPKLKMATDKGPWFINPDAIVAGARADMLRIKVLKTIRDVDPYYDPQLAAEFERQFEQKLEFAIQSDQGRSNNFLQNWIAQFPGDVNYNWMRAHGVTSSGESPAWTF